MIGLNSSSKSSTTPKAGGDFESDGLKGFDDYQVTLGDVMRGERAVMGKSLFDVQNELRIRHDYLEAIENTDPSIFDTPGFIAGYVRSYAKYLNLDAEWAFETFCTEGGFVPVKGTLGKASANKNSPFSLDASRSTAETTRADTAINTSAIAFNPVRESFLSRLDLRALASLFFLCLVVGGVIYGGWRAIEEIQRVDIAPVELPPLAASDIDPLAGFGATERTDQTLPETAVAQMATPAVDPLDRLHRPAALDVPIFTPRDTPIAVVDPNAVGNFVTPDTSQSDVSQQASVAGELPADSVVPNVMLVQENAPQVHAAQFPDVSLLAVRRTWVRVRSSDGSILFEKILNRGERFTLPTTETPPTLRAGNSGSLYFQVGDRIYGPAGQGAAVVKGVELSSHTIVTNYPIANPQSDAALEQSLQNLAAAE